VRGEVLLITPRKVYFRNHDGEGPFPRAHLADSSQKTIDRLAMLANDVFELQRRLATASEADSQEGPPSLRSGVPSGIEH
jgi:hypothetical protein